MKLQDYLIGMLIIGACVLSITGLLKALVWPTFLVFEVLKFVGA